MMIGELIQKYMPMALAQLRRLDQEEYLELRGQVIGALKAEDERRGLTC